LKIADVIFLAQSDAQPAASKPWKYFGASKNKKQDFLNKYQRSHYLTYTDAEVFPLIQHPHSSY